MNNRVDGIIIENSNLELTDYLFSTLQKIFDPIPVPIILVDSETKVKMINTIFADYLGYFFI